VRREFQPSDMVLNRNDRERFEKIFNGRVKMLCGKFQLFIGSWEKPTTPFFGMVAEK
jgi:hypothetical protein